MNVFMSAVDLPGVFSCMQKMKNLQQMLRSAAALVKKKKKVEHLFSTAPGIVLLL